MTEEVATPILENIPGLFLSQIPAGTYDINPDEDIATIGDVTIVIAHKDFDPNLVYEFVKTTLENRDSLMEAAPTLDFVATETALIGLAGGEIHPGARQYFEEISLDLPN